MGQEYLSIEAGVRNYKAYFLRFVADLSVVIDLDSSYLMVVMPNFGRRSPFPFVTDRQEIKNQKNSKNKIDP